MTAQRFGDGRWRVVIVVDGDPPLPGWRRIVASGATVIAADGGARHAEVEGVAITDVVGDLDSLATPAVEALNQRGVRIHRHEVDKDFTDFELAARLAVVSARRGGNKAVLVVGGAGGRIDHALGNIAVLGGPVLGDCSVTALLGDALLQIARPGRPLSLFGHPGDTVSLIPFGGPAGGVTTRGLRFALADDLLQVGRTRGISNVITELPACVSIDRGVLAVVEPEAVQHVVGSE